MVVEAGGCFGGLRRVEVTRQKRCDPLLVFQDGVARTATHETLERLNCIVDVARSGAIRKTADHLHDPVGTDPQDSGVRARAGDVAVRAHAALVRHARAQAADVEQAREQITALSGLRRGHVGTVCSQAFVDHVMPTRSARFERDSPPCRSRSRCATTRGPPRR